MYKFENPSLLQVMNALPQQFDFYHLGKIQLQGTEIFIENTQSIGFQFIGDLSAWMIVFFQSTLDASMYAEVGNLLASQVATQLYFKNGLEVMISPPQSFTQAQVQSLCHSSVSEIRRQTYCHFYQNSVIPIETWVISVARELKGHA